ncbi:MAG: hypothetical protein ABJZ69_09680 [Hyphomicrobiales bacterium]
MASRKYEDLRNPSLLQQDTGFVALDKKKRMSGKDYAELVWR